MLKAECAEMNLVMNIKKEDSEIDVRLIAGILEISVSELFLSIGYPEDSKVMESAKVAMQLQHRLHLLIEPIPKNWTGVN
jgi:hypothetical protein